MATDATKEPEDDDPRSLKGEPVKEPWDDDDQDDDQEEGTQ